MVDPDSSGNHILANGTQVVALGPVLGPRGAERHPRGAVGIVVQAPLDQHHAYLVRFPDEFEAPLRRKEFVLLTTYQRQQLEKPQNVLAEYNLLVARKLTGPEKSVLAEADMDFHRGEYERLSRELEQAGAASTLPERATTADELNELLVRLRLGSVTKPAG